MLDNYSDDKVRYCYLRVGSCRERAARTRDPALKASLLAIEENWLRLARGYELTEAVSLFNKEIRRLLRKQDDSAAKTVSVGKHA